MTFENLNIIEPIGKAIRELGYTEPTPIQEEAIPAALANHDILGCAQTGTGKTAAFAIPILQKLYGHVEEGRAKEIKALILTPTRELAIQISDNFASYGIFTKLRHTVIFGGVNQKSQTDELQRGIDVLIATPGRLLDLIQQRYISLSNIEYFVLDEADRMLDMGFIHDIRKILPLLPKKKQTLFFSATMPAEITRLANSMLQNPVRIEVTPVSSTVDLIHQSVYFVEKPDKKDVLIDLLRTKALDSVLIFVRTKHGADRIARILNKAGIKSDAIHGDKSQSARQRALNNFREHISRILIATDIAARGIDVEKLACVINYDLPNVPETYVHRIGRTGRAGNDGVAYSLCCEEERPYLKDIEKLIQKKIEVEGTFAPSQPVTEQAKSQERVRKNERQPRANRPRSEFAQERKSSKPKSEPAPEREVRNKSVKTRENRNSSAGDFTKTIKKAVKTENTKPTAEREPQHGEAKHLVLHKRTVTSDSKPTPKREGNRNNTTSNSRSPRVRNTAKPYRKNTAQRQDSSENSRQQWRNDPINEEPKKGLWSRFKNKFLHS